MTEDDLPDDDHVVRYVKPTSVQEDGGVDGSGFIMRQGDNSLSVNWLEFFSGYNKVQQLNEVRRLSRLKMSKRGCLAELNVGKTKQYVLRELSVLRFVHKPLTPEPEYEADPSHSEIARLPPREDPQAMLIGDMIAKCVKAIHPACNS